jgi:hypothetical protein
VIEQTKAIKRVFTPLKLEKTHFKAAKQASVSHKFGALNYEEHEKETLI